MQNRIIRPYNRPLDFVHVQLKRLNLIFVVCEKNQGKYIASPAPPQSWHSGPEEPRA